MKRLTNKNPRRFSLINLSLAFTTYQTGKMFLLGRQPDGRLSVFERTFNRCMGLCTGDQHSQNGGHGAQTLWMSSLYQLWRFENVLPPGQLTRDGYDRLYVPMLGNTTGDIDIHDMVVPRDSNADAGEEINDGPVFACTLFNCLGTTSDTHSFKPLWKPPFISQLAAEDRCHLNGLAVDPETNQPKFVTCVSRSDVADGWRDRRESGGVVVDVETDGFLGYVDLKTGQFEEVTFLSGYGRGMAIVGPYAIVGLSTCRENRTFSGLPLDANLDKRDAEPRCGLQVIDLRTGESPHWVRLGGILKELYDVVALPGVVRPMALGFKTDEIRRMLRLEDMPADKPW